MAQRTPDVVVSGNVHLRHGWYQWCARLVRDGVADVSVTGQCRSSEQALKKLRRACDKLKRLGGGDEVPVSKPRVWRDGLRSR